ncbi:TPA: hypothetical protein DDW35_01970 [Candidatus Sumerlaeota bacterium]|jgi:DNA-binding XRE family transcriptional regulator|nr:hypothetical protein [Candidatus Sumerlaeota bacterium]
MARYSEIPKSPLAARLMSFRKKNHLTQADLAVRYGVSGPAIFKFEKGFVLPSLRLWQKMAADMDIPDKEAVLMWIKEKVPARLNAHLKIGCGLDTGALIDQISALADSADAYQKRGALIMDNPDVSPSLKRFISDSKMWDIFKPCLDEIIFLVEIDQQMHRLNVNQFRDVLIVGRSIRVPEADE